MSLDSQLFIAPDVPSSFDDEFNVGASLDPKWSILGALSGLAPDAHATINNDEDIRLSHNVQRASWLRMQTDAAGAAIYQGIRQTPSEGVILPDGFYWARFFANWRLTNVINNDSGAGLFLYSLNGDVVDDSYFMGLEADASAMNMSFFEREGGSVTNQEAGSDIDQRGMVQEYIGIRKEGNAYEGWAASSGGNWMRFNSYNYGGAQVIDSIALMQRNDSTAAPGNSICGFDFFRYRSDGTLP